MQSLLWNVRCASRTIHRSGSRPLWSIRRCERRFSEYLALTTDLGLESLVGAAGQRRCSWRSYLLIHYVGLLLVLKIPKGNWTCLLSWNALIHSWGCSRCSYLKWRTSGRVHNSEISCRALMRGRFSRIESDVARPIFLITIVPWEEQLGLWGYAPFDSFYQGVATPSWLIGWRKRASQTLKIWSTIITINEALCLRHS